MSSILAIIPVLRRPHRVFPLWQNWKSTVDILHPSNGLSSLSLLFVAQEGDVDEIAVLAKYTGRYTVVSESCSRWSQKINRAIEKNPGCDWYWFAADDLEFQQGWPVRLGRWMETSSIPKDGSRPCVIGSSDGANPSTMAGHTSTHPIVSRAYVAAHGPPLFEGYHHNFVDAEFVAVAKHRRSYVHAPLVLAKHLHPIWGTAPNDDTYRLGKSHFAEDKALFLARRAAGGW